MTTNSVSRLAACHAWPRPPDNGFPDDDDQDHGHCGEGKQRRRHRAEDVERPPPVAVEERPCVVVRERSPYPPAGPIVIVKVNEVDSGAGSLTVA